MASPIRKITDNYWNWFDVDVASGLNAHLRHLAESPEENTCINIFYLDQLIEIPIHKRCFKTKPNTLASLIRTSHVGRQELQEIRKSLELSGFSLKLRRSPKKKFLNQVVASVPVDDPTYPLKVRLILSTIAETLEQEMPEKVGIGYCEHIHPEALPGTYQFHGDVESLAYKIGHKVGSTIGILFKDD